MKRIEFGLLCLFILMTASAQTRQSFIFSGTVRDRQSGNPIPDANIMLREIEAGTVSFENGLFFIRSIPPGTYDVEVNVIGYESLKSRVRIESNTRMEISLDTKPVPFNPVLVTATRSRHLQSEVTACSDVLTPALWNGQNGNTVAEILESTGSLFVKDNGGFAGIKTLSVRGSSDAQVLVLLDGQRLNTAQSGGVDLNAIPLDALDRIEVVRGGHSGLMGTDAMGGAVNLITRLPNAGKKASIGAGQTVGSFGTVISNAFVSFTQGPLQSSLLFNRLQSDGDFSFKLPGENRTRIRENNDIRGDAVFFKSRMDGRNLGDFQLAFQSFQSDRGAADPVFFPSSSGRRNETRRLAGLGWQKQISPSIQLTAQGHSQFLQNRFTNLYENDDHRYGSSGIETGFRWAFNPFGLLQGGAEWNEDRLKSTKFLIQRRSTLSLYGVLEANGHWRSFGKTIEWKFVPAFRLDHHDDHGTVVCPKIGALIRTGRIHTVTLRGNAGRNYRLPTFNDLYWPELVWPGYGGTRGNPHLRPETGMNFDLGTTFQKIAPFFLQLEMTFHQNYFQNLILWQSDAEYVFSPVNVGKALIRGMECLLSFRTLNNRLHLELAPSWTLALDRTSSKWNRQLTYRPDWKIDAGAGFRVSRLTVNGQVQYIGKRFTSADNQKCLPSYWTLNGNVGWKQKIGPVEAGMRMQVSNWMGKPVFSLDGYPLPGREYRISMDLVY